MKTKAIIAIIMLILLLAGCDINATVLPTLSPGPEGKITSIQAETLKLKNGVLTFGFTAEVSGAAELEILVSSSGERILSSTVKAENGYNKIEADCPEAEELEISVLENKVERIYLKMKNGAPQLTRDGVKCVINAMRTQEKANLVTGVRTPVKAGATGETYAIERLGVPAIEMADGPAGVRYTQTSVWYPSVSNLSSSWDRSLVSRVATSIGKDALALGFDIVLAPGMNLQKNILCGRNFEYCSEDPLLTAQIATAYVNGLQSTGAKACIKHFAVNSQESARYTVSSNLTERALRELYLKAFGYVVRDADPAAVMSSYNRINGVYASDSYELLTLILRSEMGFDGLVMSDWDSKGDIVDKIKAGNDLNMPGNADDPDKVISAINNGRLKMAELDAACENILNAIVASPSFNGVSMNDRDAHRNNKKEHESISETAAEDTVILLKNDQALPFADGYEIAVFGNGAYNTVFGGQGSGSVSPTDRVSIMSGINQSDSLSVYDYKNNAFNGCNPHVQGDDSADVRVSREYVMAQAAGADAAVVVFSRDSQESYDRSDIKGDFLLNDTELEMLELVCDEFHNAGKKVVVVINTGAPMEVASWRDKVDGILYCGYAGQATGTAVASVLSGKVNPSAKTVSSWPLCYSDTPSAEYFPGNALDVTYYEDIYVGYRYYTTFNKDVAYPFGYGLSYTGYEYEDITLTESADSITVTVRVKNVGERDGREIVQLYVSKPESLQEQASIELCGFEKTAVIAPDGSETVSITVKKDDLVTYDEKTSSWVLASGKYSFFVGKSSAEVLFAGDFTQSENKTVSDVENRCVPDEELEYIKKSEFDNAPQSKRENIALGKQAWSNYDEYPYYKAAYAVDGSRTSRWSGKLLSEGVNIWQVDLGKEYKVGQIEIFWQTVSKPFDLLTSKDGVNFTKYKTYSCDASLQSSINLRATEARYLRLEIQPGAYVSIFEFKAFEATQEDMNPEILTNIALNKSTTASAGESQYPKQNAVDGDTATRWSAQYSGKAYLEVDLGAEYNVKGLEMLLESAWSTYKVEYSLDGSRYTLLADGAKDQLSLILDDINVNARYIRVSRDGEGWFSIIELSVLG